MFKFALVRNDQGARRGQVHTVRGVIETPCFMPVATQGTIKTLTTKQVEDLGAQIVLSNTYHMMLRPGSNRVESLGGLHQMMQWSRPILTDSGGFQIASLSALNRVDDDGVTFRSHIDGSEHRLTPESAVVIQGQLGSDIAMVLDECLTYPATEGDVRRAAERSLQWAERSLHARDRSRRDQGAPQSRQALFGIVQGGAFANERRTNARALVELNFDGYGIGGLAVGEPKELTLEMTRLSTDELPQDKPRYLMGAGTPLDILDSVARGVDMFDCVLPTRNARRGTLFTSEGKLVLRNARFADDPAPPDLECGCYTCQNFTRAYLRHLLQAKESTGATLATIHNLWFYLTLMRRTRESIDNAQFAAFHADWKDRLEDP